MEQVVEEYGEYLLHIAFLYVKNRQVAEDITQDVLCTYMIKQQFNGASSLKTYLTRMLINRCHDELRKMKRREIIQRLLPIKKANASAEEEVMRSEQGSSLMAQVIALPLHYREVIILYYYEEFTVREMVEVLKVSENTIRTRLRRGKQLLKEQLIIEEGVVDGF